MHAVAALLAAAAAGHVLARLFRAPAIPFLILAGVALSAFHPPEPGVIEDGLVLGVAFLLFVAGMELDPRRVRAQRRAAVEVGVAQFLVLAVLGYGAARLLGFEQLPAAYLALALTASSTLIGVRLLQKRGQMFEPFGRLTLGVLLVQDVLVLVSIPLVMELTTGWMGAARAAAGLVVLGAVGLVVRRWLGPLLLRIIEEQELVLLVALAILHGFIALAWGLGLPIVVGAFVAGVGLSRFPVNGIVRNELAPIRDFFSAIFFTALGALVQLPAREELLAAAVLALVVVIVTPPLVTVLAERAGVYSKAAIEAGLLLSQTSEISLVIGLAGMIQGHIGADVFTVIALVTVATMVLTPFLATDDVAWRLMHLHPSRRRRSARPPQDHVLLLGAGATGMPLLEDLIISGCDIVVVDDDPAVVQQLAEAGLRTIRGDASDPAVLREAGADRARVVSSTIRRPRDNGALLDMTADVPVLVRVFDQHDADWVTELGGTPVLYSEAAADGVIEWFEASLRGVSGG